MSTQPNIIVLFSDQQRWDTLGCYGQALPISPNLDKMAAEGTLFEYSFTCQPVCGPARACLQTGLYATQIGTYRNNIALPLDQDTIAKQLSSHGYSVGYIGKWHLASNKGGSDTPIGETVDYIRTAIPPERRGGYKDYWLASDALEATSHSYDGHMFDENGNKVEFPPGRYRVDAVTDYVLEYLKSPRTNSPFFLFVSYIEPHHQNDHNQYEGPKGSQEKFQNYTIPGDLLDTQGDWQKNFPDYLGCCHSLDENVGRIRTYLTERGLAENTILIYTSDHGSHFRTRNTEYKRACHDACIRVPLIISGGPFSGGKTISNLISVLDLPSTILDLAGIPIPHHFQGRSLLPLLKNTNSRWRDTIFLQISEAQVGRAIRTKKWKYSVKAPGKDGYRFAKSRIYVEEFLYDLEKDPHERTNLIAHPKYNATRVELQDLLIEEMVRVGEPEPIIFPVTRAPENGFYFSNRFKVDAEGEITAKMQMDKGFEAMDVPIGELLEPILNLPLYININGKKYKGTLSFSNEQLQFESEDRTTQRFSAYLSNCIGFVVSIMTLIPNAEELSQCGSFKPHWILLILKE